MEQAYSYGGEVTGVDSDRVDDGRRSWRPAVGAVLCGLLIGAVVGGLFGISRPQSYSAHLSLSVLPDSAVTSQVSGLPAGAPSEDATSFIQSQLVVLNGDPLRDEVQRRARLPSRPELMSTQIGQTYVVQVTATATRSSQALAAVRAAGQAYAARRQEQLSSDVDSAIASVQQQVQSVRSSLPATATATALEGGVNPQTSALRDEYERLLAVSSALQLSKAQVGRAVTTVTPAAISSGGALSATAKDTLAGGLLGALLALAGLMLIRRAFPRVRSLSDLSALGLPVLLPVLPRRTMSGRRGLKALRSSEGRLLACRLAAGELTVGRPLVIIGASRSAGASYVATAMAVNLADTVPVLLLLAAEAVTGRSAREGLGLPPDAPCAVASAPPPDLPGLLERAVASAVVGVAVLPCGGGGPEGVRHLRALLAGDLLDEAGRAGWTVVIDAPALTESALGIDCARTGGGAVVVAGRSVSRPVELLGMAELFDVHGGLMRGVILNDVPHHWWRRPRRGDKRDVNTAQSPGGAGQRPHANVTSTPNGPSAYRPVPSTLRDQRVSGTPTYPEPPVSGAAHGSDLPTSSVASGSLPYGHENAGAASESEPVDRQAE